MKPKILGNLRWLGHASFLLRAGEKNIYFDPYGIKEGLPKADLILITHPHFDHLSPEDIARVWRKGSVVVIPETASSGLSYQNHISIRPGEEVSVGEFRIRALPAYNVDKAFHPREKNWVGYLVETPLGSVYHAGDTDFIPEMRGLKADVALLPVGGTYTMDWREAAEAARAMEIGAAVPMHWGRVVGSRRDAELFAENFPAAEILEEG